MHDRLSDEIAGRKNASTCCKHCCRKKDGGTFELSLNVTDSFDLVLRRSPSGGRGGEPAHGVSQSSRVLELTEQGVWAKCKHFHSRATDSAFDGGGELVRWLHSGLGVRPFMERRHASPPDRSGRYGSPAPWVDGRWRDSPGLALRHARARRGDGACAVLPPRPRHRAARRVDGSSPLSRQATATHQPVRSRRAQRLCAGVGKRIAGPRREESQVSD